MIWLISSHNLFESSLLVEVVVVVVVLAAELISVDMLHETNKTSNETNKTQMRNK